MFSEFLYQLIYNGHLDFLFSPPLVVKFKIVLLISNYIMNSISHILLTWNYVLSFKWSNVSNLKFKHKVQPVTCISIMYLIRFWLSYANRNLSYQGPQNLYLKILRFIWETRSVWQIIQTEFFKFFFPRDNIIIRICCMRHV